MWRWRRGRLIQIIAKSIEIRHSNPKICSKTRGLYRFFGKSAVLTVPNSSPLKRDFVKMFRFQSVKREAGILDAVTLKNMLENTGFIPIFWKIRRFDRVEFVTSKPLFFKSYYISIY